METQQGPELDLMGLLLYLKKKIWLIALVTLLAALIGWVGSLMMTTELYTATTQVYVYQQDQNVMDYNNLVIASQLRKDCVVIIKGESVTREVVERLNLPMDPKALGRAIKVETEDNTRILRISYTDTDPERATLIVNTVREVAAEITKELMHGDVLGTLFEAERPFAESTTNVRKSTLTGAAVGAAAILVLLVLAFLMDDTIRTEDDVTTHLGVCTLAVIPLSNELHVNRGGSKGNSQRRGTRRR